MPAAGASTEELRVGPGFGLAPVQRSAVGGGRPSALAAQLAPPVALGKWSGAVQTTVVPAGAPGARTGGADAAGAVGVDAKLADFMDSLKDLGAFE